MARLLIHVEGETEETFVNEVLAVHLYAKGYEKISARLMGDSRQRDRRGGIRGWNSARGDILRHLKEDAGTVVTTMVDYYGLPQTGSKAWPGRAKAATLTFEKKAETVEDALLTDVCQEMGRNFNARRFIPYVMMHEFEGLLFSDCERFASGIGQPDLAWKFQAIRDQFTSPEEIDDSPITAPSKRVQALVPSYEKPLLGTLAMIEIGLDKIRAECPHFRRWIERLETCPT
jgi:hypothetical protein